MYYHTDDLVGYRWTFYLNLQNPNGSIQIQSAPQGEIRLQQAYIGNMAYLASLIVINVHKLQ